MTRRIAFVSTMESNAWGGSEELWAATAAELLSRACGACEREGVE